MNEEEIKAIEKIKWSIQINNMTKEINGNSASINVQVLETVLNLLENKDKMIDLMGEKIFEEGIVWENKEDVKQYFENKVTDTNVGERKVENGN